MLSDEQRNKNLDDFLKRLKDFVRDDYQKDPQLVMGAYLKCIADQIRNPDDLKVLQNGLSTLYSIRSSHIS